MFSTVSEAFLFLRPNGLNSPIQHLFNTFTAKATSSIQNFQPVEKCADSNLPNVSISPVGGEITPLEAHPTSRSLQPLEKSPRHQTSQRAKTPSRWNNPPANRPFSVPIPPVSGRINPSISILKSENTQSVGESSRRQASQRPHSSSQRKNPPANRPSSGQNIQRVEKTGRLLRRTLLRYTARHSRTMHGTKFPSDSRGPALQAQARAPSQTRRTPDTPLPSLKGFRNTAIVEKWGIEKRLQFQRTRPSLLKKSLGGSYHSSLEFL